MGTTLVSIIGSLIVVMLGLILYMLKATRGDLQSFQKSVEEDLKDIREKLSTKIEKGDCIHWMEKMERDTKDAIRERLANQRGAE